MFYEAFNALRALAIMTRSLRRLEAAGITGMDVADNPVTHVVERALAAAQAGRTHL
jgi:hypothetical protein